MRTNTQAIKPKHFAMLAVLLAGLVAALLLAACVAPVVMLASLPRVDLAQVEQAPKIPR